MGNTRPTGRNCTSYLLSTAIAISLGLTASGAANAALEEVIVTAQKRDENIQTVPVAITALTQESLETNRVSNVSDLNGLAPNVAVRPAAGGTSIASFSMRGITSYGVVPGSDKEVSIYLDGVYIGSPRGSIFSLPDIAQLEVLRGPQGTLFGRNATAGAVNITTRDPKGEFGFRQDLSTGDHDYRRTRTSIDSPMFGPFSATATYAKEMRDGDIRNNAGGTVWDRSAFGYGTAHTPSRLGSTDIEDYFLAVKFEPTDTFTMTYKYDRSVDHGTPDANVPIFMVPGTTVLPPTTTLGALAAGQALPPISNPIQFASNGGRPSHVTDRFAIPRGQTNQGHSFTTLADVSDSVSIKNITAFRKTEIHTATDLVGLGLAVPLSATTYAPFCLACTQVDNDSDQWSTELQVNYDSDLLTATVGALYYEQKDRSGGYVNAFNSGGGLFINNRIPAGNEATSFNENESAAIYTQVEYHLKEELDLVVGVRETRDRKSAKLRQGTDPNKIERSLDFEESKPSWTLGVNYKPTYGTLVYGKYSEAFVSGGGVPGFNTFESEIAKSWEAGIKSDLFDNNVRTNLTVFDVTYEHVQSAQGGRNVGRPDLGTVVIDLESDIKAYGFEWEGAYSAGYGVTLNASAGFTHVYYPDEVSPAILSSVQANPAAAGYLPGSKYRPTLIPDWNGSLSANYESDPLFGTAYFTFNVVGTWHSEFKLNANEAQVNFTPGLSQMENGDEGWVVNARTSLKEIDLGSDVKGEVAVWGRNLTDYDEPIYALNIVGVGGGANYMQARSFGVDFTVQY